MIDIPSPLHGECLETFLTQELPPTEPLIEEFLYRQHTMMLAADPKTGKSSISLQVAASLSSATPLFGQLLIPKPQPVYYLAFETLAEEFRRQVRAMQEIAPLNAEHFCWDDKLIGINVLKPDHAALVIERIRPYQPALVIVDPIYMMVSGGLSKDEPASGYVRFLRLLKDRLNTALLLTHHTHRERYTAEGVKIEEDNPFYGSQWLRAFVHVSYHIKKRDKSHTGVILTKRDDRTRGSLSTLTLNYDPQTMCCLMEEAGSDTYFGKLLEYLADCRKQRKATDFYEVLATVGCSEVHLRRLIARPDVQEQIRVVKQGNRRPKWELV